MTQIAEAYAAMRTHQPYLAAPPTLARADRQRLAESIPADHIGVFSSGSTSTPRCILRSWESWRASFPAIDSRLGVAPAETVGLIGPPYSTMVLFAAVHALHHGALPRVLAPDRLPADPGASDRPVVDVLHAVPTAAADFLDEVIHGHRPPPRLVVTAGAPAPASLWQSARRAGVSLVEYYGAAETSFIGWRSTPGPFDPVPGVDIEIRDGVIWVRSPYLAEGYLSCEGAAMRRDGDWVTVGDLGCLDERGGLIVRGRGDSAVTTAGHTILVADVEAVLRAVPGVDEVAVVGIEHERMGEIIAAVVAGPATDEALRTAARRLPPAARPRLWVHSDDLPRLPGGKIDRATVRLQVVRSRGAR